MCGKEPVIPQQQMGVGGLGLIFLSLRFITLMIFEEENVISVDMYSTHHFAH